MGKQTAQGTRWESRIVNGVKMRTTRPASRLAKAGQKDEADVRIPGIKMRPMVAWERWVGKKGDDRNRRRAVRMVTITEAHFFELIDKDEKAEYGYWVQCKSTQSLSLSRTMEGLQTWVSKNTPQA